MKQMSIVLLLLCVFISGTLSGQENKEAGSLEELLKSLKSDKEIEEKFEEKKPEEKENKETLSPKEIVETVTKKMDNVVKELDAKQHKQDKIITDQREIVKLDRLVDFLNHYQEGQRRYGNGDYEGAARSFQRALEYAPNNARVRELHRNAQARSLGSKKAMTGEVRIKYNQGIRFYQNGRYEEAIRVWEEALELDPHNIHIIEALEGAREKLNLYKKKE